MGGVSGLIVLVLACIIWTRMYRRTHVGSKGSEWSQKPHFEEMYSSMQATADFDAVKPSHPEGKFSIGGRECPASNPAQSLAVLLCVLGGSRIHLS